MTEQSDSGSSNESDHSEQPAAALSELGGDEESISPDEIEIVGVDEVLAPVPAFEEAAPSINADLIDDPEELARTIEAATGQSVEVVSESENEADEV